MAVPKLMLMRLALIIGCRVVPCFLIVHPNCAQSGEGGLWIHIKVRGYRWNRLDVPIFRACQTFSDWVKHSSHIVESCHESCLTDSWDVSKSLQHYRQNPILTTALQYMNYVFTACFTIEAIMRLYAMGFAVRKRSTKIRTAKKYAADIIEVFTIDPPYNISDELYLVGQIKGTTAAVGKSTNWIEYMEHLLSIGVRRKIWKEEWGLLHKEQI